MIEKLPQTNNAEDIWCVDKLNEIIDVVNDNNFRYEEGYSDGYAAAKEDVSGAEDELKLDTLDELKLKYDHLVGIDDPYDVDEFWADS